MPTFRVSYFEQTTVSVNAYSSTILQKMVEQYAFTLVCSKITNPNNLGPESTHQAVLRDSEDLMAHSKYPMIRSWMILPLSGSHAPMYLHTTG